MTADDQAELVLSIARDLVLLLERTIHDVSEHKQLAREAAERRRPTCRRRRYSEADKATALALVAEGKSLREAGRAVGATHPTVLRWLRDAA